MSVIRIGGDAGLNNTGRTAVVDSGRARGHVIVVGRADVGRETAGRPARLDTLMSMDMLGFVVVVVDDTGCIVVVEDVVVVVLTQPSSVWPLQLSSTPLQISVAPGLMAELVSSQSVESVTYPEGTPSSEQVCVETAALPYPSPSAS